MATNGTKPLEYWIAVLEGTPGKVILCRREALEKLAFRKEVSRWDMRTHPSDRLQMLMHVTYFGPLPSAERRDELARFILRSLSQRWLKEQERR